MTTFLRHRPGRFLANGAGFRCCAGPDSFVAWRLAFTNPGPGQGAAGLFQGLSQGHQHFAGRAVSVPGAGTSTPRQTAAASVAAPSWADEPEAATEGESEPAEVDCADVPMWLEQRRREGRAVLLLDVRTVHEATEWGMIGGAKILPAHELWDALRARPETFEATFGFAQPPRNTGVLVYCQHGSRSNVAAQMLHCLGWSDVAVLRGGYHGWAELHRTK
jgi:rhodanese-related sulfurtransferase